MKHTFALMGLLTAMCLFGCNTTSTSSIENAAGVSNESGSTEVYGSVSVDAGISK